MHTQEKYTTSFFNISNSMLTKLKTGGSLQPYFFVIPVFFISILCDAFGVLISGMVARYLTTPPVVRHLLGFALL